MLMCPDGSIASLRRRAVAPRTRRALAVVAIAAAITPWRLVVHFVGSKNETLVETWVVETWVVYRRGWCIEVGGVLHWVVYQTAVVNHGTGDWLGIECHRFNSESHAFARFEYSEHARATTSTFSNSTPPAAHAFGANALSPLPPSRRATTFAAHPHSVRAT